MSKSTFAIYELFSDDFENKDFNGAVIWLERLVEGRPEFDEIAQKYLPALRDGLDLEAASTKALIAKWQIDQPELGIDDSGEDEDGYDRFFAVREDVYAAFLMYASGGVGFVSGDLEAAGHIEDHKRGLGLFHPDVTPSIRSLAPLD